MERTLKTEGRKGTRTLILDCNNNVGKEVTIEGFVEVRRDHGKIVFFDIADRSASIQVVANPDLASDLHPQDAVLVVGEVSKRPEKLVNPNLKTGAVELQAKEIKLLAKAAELPFDMGGKELDLQLPTLLDYRTLTLRHPKVKAIFKVQAAILEGFRKAAKELDCTEIVVPTIAASATEGGAEVFRVDYFGFPAYMTQSPQLYKQMMVPVFERVFTIAHAYRAEPSVTTRHLTEATQLDCEIGFVTFDELLGMLEEVAVKMLTFAQDQCKDVFESFGLEPIAVGKIPRLTVTEVQEIIFKEFGRDNRGEKDLQPQDEVDICKWALKEHKSDFVTVTRFPLKAKPLKRATLVGIPESAIKSRVTRWHRQNCWPL